jgi:hypothetical protein
MAGVLQNRLAQVVREYELEVLREKMDWMRRLEETEEAARVLKEENMQQSRLLENYAREIHLARAEIATSQKQAALSKQEANLDRMRDGDLVETQAREIIALRFLVAQEKAQNAALLKQKALSDSSRTVSKGTVGQVDKENQRPNIPSEGDASAARADSQLHLGLDRNPCGIDLPTPAAFIQFAAEGRLESLRRTLEPQLEDESISRSAFFSAVLGNALVAACGSRHLACAEMLLRVGADAAKAVDVGNEGITPLHAAAIVGDAEIVSILLQEVGVEVNALDKQHRSPLLLAIRGAHAEVAAKLLRVRHSAL